MKKNYIRITKSTYRNIRTYQISFREGISLAKPYIGPSDLTDKEFKSWIKQQIDEAKIINRRG